jgi:glycosyltransferase involved in cell wall biosynthesis
VKPPRIAIVSRAVFPIHGKGGLERSVYDLARHLADRDVPVTLITRRPGGQSDPAAVHPGVTLRFVPYSTFPLAGRRGTTVLDRSTAYPIFGMRAGNVAAGLVERGEVDLVHGFGASVLGYARRHPPLRAPLVLNPQGLEEFGATDPARAGLKRIAYLPLQRAVRLCARRADAVIATDRALEPMVRRHLEIAAPKIRTIPNAVDLEQIDALAGPADGDALRVSGTTTLLSVGRLEENKGFHILAAALGAVQERAHPLTPGAWRWVIAGTGPFRARLDAAISAAGIEASVQFLDAASDRELHAWYEAADLFVHPTLYEGSSLVTLEAMAHRRACVVTRAGGLPDKVKTGVNGWFVEPGDASALAAAISGALTDRPRLTAMGQAGRATVEREFSWTAAVEQTLRLYADLLSQGQ